MMRGVIHGINPAAHVIDLTHGIGPQDVRHGAVVLADSFSYFPTGSIFVAVVDPGVGTDRAAILLETPDAKFVAPDNGLLTLVCRQHDPSFGDTDTSASKPVPDQCRAWRLTNPDYWRHPISNTFHGRDVFAPVAAHLSLGTPPDALGAPTSSIGALALPIPRPDGNTIRGQVIFADSFGNLVTDITADTLAQIGVSPGDQRAAVTIANHTITRPVPHLPRPARYWSREPVRRRPPRPHRQPRPPRSRLGERQCRRSPGSTPGRTSQDFCGRYVS